MPVTEEQYQEWDKKHAENNFFGGDDPSSEDNENYKQLEGVEPPAKHLNLWGWFLIMNMFTEEVRNSWSAPKGDKKGGKKAEKKEDKKEEEDEDDFDAMFEETEEDKAAKASAAEKTKKAQQDAKSKGPVEKSIILFEVKPWEAEADLDELAQKILTIEKEGLTWKEQTKKEPIGYGIYKLIVGCVVEDAKVSVDDLTDKIETDYEDYVQSVDILSFNKV